MEPLKSLIPFAKWLLRIAAALVIYSLYFDTAIQFSFNSAEYFIALVAVIFAVLLLVGGFIKKPSMTVTSGLIIFLVSLIMLFLDGADLDSIITHSPTLAVGFYFMARGNRG